VLLSVRSQVPREAIVASKQAADPGADASTPVFTREGARATIRLNRPRYLNRIQPEDLTSLEEMLETIEADESVRVLVFTGTGRAFSAGYHLGDMAERERTRQAAAHPLEESHFERVANKLENLRVPTVCALNGGVYGGATDLALCCDFRIGVEATEMFMPAARLGYHFYKSGMMRYTTRLGVAPEMLRIGYLDEIVPEDELAARADALAATLAAMAPVALQGMKRTINEIARGELDATAAIARNQRSQLSEDLQEGLAAWKDKRAPVFTGR
jgi:enoyl-CoA hydratase/carnithine racemase